MTVHEFTKTGQYHKKSGEPCQDMVYRLENRQHIVIAVADGATACKNSRTGAKTACRAAARYLMEHGEALAGFDGKKAAFLLMEQVLFELKKAAEEERQSWESYASTLLCCLIHKKNRQAVFFSLGDCAAFFVSGGRCRPLLEPVRYGRNLSPLTTTEGAYRVMQVKRADLTGMEDIFACTDGVVHLMKQGTEGRSLMEQISAGNYPAVEEFLKNTETADDCGFIACGGI